jgi:hypothetical protein
MRAGITGHQALTPTAIAWLRRVLPAELVARGVDAGASNLAAGADQLFVEALLALAIPFAAVIPCAGYDDAFTDEHARAEYRRLRARAAEVAELAYDRPSEDAFYAAGIAVVDRCQLLFAVWNGRPARGRGGTANVVAYAIAAGKPVLHLNPDDCAICMLLA